LFAKLGKPAKKELLPMEKASQSKIDISVLLVEDETHARIFTETLLNKIVTKVYSVSSGQEGLEVFKNHAIDIVVTDIQMPRLSGLDMLRQMKVLKPNLLSLITTAYGETNYFLQAIELGVDRFLLKPFTEETLHENIFYLANIVLREDRLRIEEEARRLAEEQLKLSEEKFRLFFETSPQGILIIDINSSLILQANQAASTILGYSIEELQGLPINQLFKEDDIQQFKVVSKVIPYEAYLWAKDKKAIPVELLTRSLGLQGKELLLTLFSDITARKQAEEQIYTYQTKLEVLVDQRTKELSEAVEKLTQERDQKNLLYQRLERNIEIEKLVSNIASRFVNPDWNALDKEISSALESIAVFFGMERAFFWIFEPNTTQMKYRILNSSYDSAYVHRVSPGFDIQSFPVIYKALHEGRAYMIDDEHAGDVSSEEYKYIQLNKVKRLIIYPIEHQNVLAGFIGLDSGKEGKLPENLEFVIKITGKVFLDALLHWLNALEIRNTLEKLSALLNAMPDLLITVNRDGKILEINESALQFYEVSLPMSKSLSMNDILPPDIAAVRWGFVKQVFETGSKRYHLDSIGTRKYEHVFFPVSSAENKVESVGILSKDITQEYLYQQQLMENYQLLNTIINSLPNPLYYKNNEGRILGCNNAFLEFAGVESIEVMGKRLEDFLPAHSVELLQQNEKILYTTGDVQTFEIRVETKKAHFRNIQVTKSLFRDAQGKPAGVVGILVDITEIKRINEELKILNDNLSRRVEEEVQKVEKQRQALIQKSRIESLGQMAASIAHEINQPLSAISLAVDNARFKITSGRIEQKYLLNKIETIKQNLNRIKSIIEHVKTFSRPGYISKFTEVNLNRAVESALMLIFQQIKSQDIHLVLKLHPEPLFIAGDMIKMEQIIINLINNAKEAILDKEAQKGAYFKKIEISTGITGENAYLMVTDNGVGIDSVNLDKIYEPFFTTKESKQGTGLGLSIVYSLINEMRGDIKVKSKLGEGTLFTVTLPLIGNNKIKTADKYI
jgi:PAS domain S-box-containing protein